MNRGERVQRSITDLEGMDPDMVLEVSGRVSVRAALLAMRILERTFAPGADELKDLFILERDEDGPARR